MIGNYKKYLVPGIFLAVILANLIFGFPRLSRYSAVDEPYWTYDRISQFWEAVAEGKWRSTNINDKPGITTAIISGPGLWSIDPMKIRSLRDNPKDQDLVSRFVKVNFSFRLPVYLFSLLGIGLFFYFLRKLLGDESAVIGTIFIGLSPILLGISLIINPDSQLWIFVPLAIINFLLLQKTGEKKYVILTGMFMGLSILTKYVANILFVYLLGLIILDYFLSQEAYDARKIRRSLLNYILMVIISLAVYFMLFPAAWVRPERILKGTFLSVAFESIWKPFALLVSLLFLDAYSLKIPIQLRIINYLKKYQKIIIRITLAAIFAIIIFSVLNTWTGMKIFDFESILASPKSGDDFSPTLRNFSENFFSGFYALLFGLTPLSFVFMAYFIFSAIWKDYQPEKIKIAVSFLIFMVLYYAGSAFNGVGATVRYQIALYPLALILAGMGAVEFWDLIKTKKPLSGRMRYIGFAVAIFIISVWSLVSIKPFYLAYASSLLPEKYILNLKDMGDGSFEAAEYLNSLPEAQRKFIWSDKGAVCETFIGRCVTGFNKNDVKNVPFDYLVSSAGRKSRSMKMPPTMSSRFDFDDLYSTEGQSDFRIDIGDRPNNFVKVVKAEDLRKSDN